MIIICYALARASRVYLPGNKAITATFFNSPFSTRLTHFVSVTLRSERGASVS
jgi:hypothetical protein